MDAITLPSPDSRMVSLSADRDQKRLFRKPLIRTGSYVKESEGLSFEVTPETLSHFAIEFGRMHKNGVRVPVPLTHTNDPSANQGWVKEVFVDGEELIGIIELAGEGVRLANTTDVSIYVPPSITDGKGNKYTRPIAHVALVTDPVIPGLGPFEAVAASRLTTKEKSMPFAKLQAALGVKEEVTEANVETLVLSHIKTKDEELKATAKELKTAQEEASNKNKELEALQLSHKPREVDPTMMDLVRDNRNMRLANLVQAGRITPAVKGEIEKAFLAEPELKLSLQRADRTFDKVCEILMKNDPVELREISGPQAVALGRHEGESDVLVKDAERRAKDAKALRG